MVKVPMDAMTWQEMYGNGVLIIMTRTTIRSIPQKILKVQKPGSRGFFEEEAFFTLDIMRDVLHGIGFRHMHRVRKSDFAVQRHLKNNLLLRVFSQNVPLLGPLLLLKILKISLLQGLDIF